MTTAALTRGTTRTTGHYGFRQVAEMEWLKLRSVRSTAWIMGVFAAGMIGIAILVLGREDWASMAAADRAGFDPTDQGFAGLAEGGMRGRRSQHRLANREGDEGEDLPRH